MVRAPPRSFDMHFLLGFNIAAVCLKISQNYNEIPTRANFQPKNGKKVGTSFCIFTKNFSYFCGMKNSPIIMMAAIGAIGATAGTSAASGKDIDYNGIDRRIATERRAKVDSLCYDISFSLPAERDKRIEGKETVSFSYTGRPGEELLLDFKGEAGQIREVILNGAPYDAEMKGEHLAFPDSLMQQGRNDITITFTAGERALNRRDDFLYTLFVPCRARTVFPCFDQPDMKATFRLKLEVPEEWQAVSNTIVEKETELPEGRKLVTFGPTEPLSTYLFAFAAGAFQREEFKADGRRFGIYYRETDPARIAQLPDIAADVAASLAWQEEYTGIPYPFCKYDLVIIPGFQFGGMEHTGATFYSDTRMFLPANATPDDRLSRTQLIAHETTHMWFGDYLTMRWFDDVWTKEVFANYYAAAITRERLPQFDHDLDWLRTYVGAAQKEDRTTGATSIRQRLDNLGDAGLVYNNIIYDKAPVMMAKLVELMGSDAFRAAIREYLDTYGYGNATWDELVAILARHTDKPVEAFSHAWVNEAGWPEIRVTTDGKSVTATQRDRRGSATLWPQSFGVAVYDGDSMQSVTLTFSAGDSTASAELPQPMATGSGALTIANHDGRGYGLFTLGVEEARGIADLLKSGNHGLSNAGATAQLMNLQENALCGNIDKGWWASEMADMAGSERDPLRGMMLAQYIGALLPDIADSDSLEARLIDMATSHPIAAVGTTLLRGLYTSGKSPATTQAIYRLWEEAASPLLGERDYMDMALQLAVRMPESSDSLTARQLERISNPDRRKQFAFVSHAVAPTAEARKAFFNELLKAENRTVEPWTGKALSLLCHTLRGAEAAAYIRPALEILPEIQATGDIFFPANWCRNLLSGQRTPEAREALRSYLDGHPDLKPMLRSKVLIGGAPLLNNQP